VPDRRERLETTFVSLRLYDSVYTCWSGGDREFYNLTGDPHELDNAAERLLAEQRSELESKMARLREPMAGPACFVERPFSSNAVFSRSVRLAGLAEAASRVRAVRLVISDITEEGQTQFWDGAGWKAERTVLSAELAAPDTPLSNWSYDFRPAVQTPQRRYRVAAWTLDESPPEKPVVSFKDFSIDAEPPVTEVLAPVADRLVKFNGGFIVRGIARDQAGIRNVRLALIDPGTGRHWNGTAWQQELVWLGAELKRPRPDEVAWSYHFRPDMGEGSVRVDLQTVTTDGRRERIERAVRLRWDE
jgi:hypothetical protein